MVAKKLTPGEAVTTLGIVLVGSSVEILDLEIEPGTSKVFVHTKLRAVVEKVQR